MSIIMMRGERTITKRREKTKNTNFYFLKTKTKEKKEEEAKGQVSLVLFYSSLLFAFAFATAAASNMSNISLSPRSDAYVRAVLPHKSCIFTSLFLCCNNISTISLWPSLHAKIKAVYLMWHCLFTSIFSCCNSHYNAFILTRTQDDDVRKHRDDLDRSVTFTVTFILTVIFWGLFGFTPPHCRVSLKVVRAFKKPIPLKLMARIWIFN